MPLDSLRPSVQSFNIRGDKDTILTGAMGTTVVLSRNTFVNSSGQWAKNVMITLAEIPWGMDVITAGLQTKSNDRILQTDGMFFLDAKENGKTLTVAENKSIYIEVKSASKMLDAAIFEGAFDGNGRMNWKTKQVISYDLIPIPTNLLKFQDSYGEEACTYPEIVDQKISTGKYENTYVATREFESRVKLMVVCGDSPEEPFAERLMNIYLENIDQPLYLSDSLAVTLLVDRFKSQIDTTKIFVGDSFEGYVTELYRRFLTLYRLRQGRPIPFDKLMMNDNTTVQELISRGVSEIEAENDVAMFKVRKQIIEERTKARKVEDDKNRVYRLEAYTFRANKLGWVNVDRFLNDEQATESSFAVQTKSKDSIDFVSVMMAIPNYRVVLNSVSSVGNAYSFTKKDEFYRKLPVGQPAVVFAFSYKNGESYFGKKEIVIPKDGQIQLNLDRSNVQNIRKEIASALK